MFSGISIIIPVYNAEPYLATTIGCILEQTYQDWELILIDDGSTDGSRSILEHYTQADKRIHAYYFDNGGCAMARNRGLEYVTRDYVVFIDNDDYISENYLATLTDEVSGYDYLVSGYYSLSREKFERKQLDAYERARIGDDLRADNRSQLAQKIPLFDQRPSVLSTVWAKVFKNSIIEKHKIRFPLSSAEDHIFSYTYFKHISSMKQIAWAGYYHIEASTSLGASHRYIADLDCIHTMQRLYEDIIKIYSVNNQGYKQNLRWRSMNRYTSLAFKGYHQDTRLNRKERLSVLNSISRDSWFRQTKKADLLGNKRMLLVYYVCRWRAFAIADIIFNLITKIHSTLSRYQ